MADKSKTVCTANIKYQLGHGDKEVRDRIPVTVELRRPEKKGRRIGTHLSKKFRPASMTALPTSSRASSCSGGRVNVFASAFGKGLNFAKPKAFCSELHLRERVVGYNNKSEDTYKLKMVQAASQEEVCSGILKFHYSDGLDSFSENIHVQSKSTVGELLPDLITTFLPHEYQLAAIDGNQPSSVTLVQGLMERELDLTEKPLEIVLDCSSRGISSPRFIFKSSLATTGVPLTPHRIKRFMSCEGVEEGFAECSVDCDHNLYNPEHYTSMTSLSSNLSIASNKSKKSKSTSSLVTKTSKKKKLAAQQQVLSNQNSSSHNSISSSHSRLHAAIQQDAPSPASTLKKNRHKAAAVSSFFSRSLRGQKKRNVRSLADSFPNSFDQDSSNNREEETEEDEDNDDEGIHFSVNTLVSHHVTLERKFSLSTVMHIYYTEGKQAQVYKSVLVSEKATTRELIAQALERYNMRMKDPSDFTLFDVIGKWQEVTTASALESQLQYQGNWNRGGGIDANSTLSNLSLLNTSPSSPNHMAVEEFVVCYCRELAPSESPYKMQYYLTAQEGFTRRFELQSKVSGERGICHAPYHKENSHSMDTVEWPDEDTPTPHDGNNIKEDMADTEIFEDALHRKRARRNRILHPSVDITNPDNSITILDSPGEELNLVGERSEGREEVGGMTLDNKMNVLRGSHRLQADDHDDLDIPISTNTSFAPNITTLGCSSPDSGVEFQKRTTQSNSNKSSVSSEQSELGNMAITSTESHIASTLCPGNLKSAFLLSLHLCNPHEEPLIYRLNDDSTEIVINSEPSASLSSASSKNRIFLISSKIGSEGLLCSICRSPPSMEPGSIHSHTHNKNIHTNSSYTSCTYNLIRGQSKLSLLHDGEEVTGSATLRHGNLLTIGDSYLFMFQDYSAIENGKNYCWRPKICSSVVEEMEDQRKSSSSRETITEMDSKSRTEGNTTGFKDHSLSSQRSDALEKDGTSPIAVEILTVDNRVNCNRLACLQELQEPTSSYSSHVEPLMLAKSPSSVATTVNVTQVPTSSSTPRVGFELEPVFPTTAGKETSSVYSTCMSHKTRAEKLKKNYHLALGKTHSLPLPTDRKLVFSFKTTEEDKLLSHIIMEDRKGDESTSVSHSPCKLAPAYILAMCTEYSIMSSGPEAVRRFVQKTIDRIQDVVWACTKRLSLWNPDPEIHQKPLQQMKELFPLLEPVFLWLANALELYNFLHMHRSSFALSSPPSPRSLTDAMKGSKGERGERVAEAEETPMEVLYSILVYTYQQAFYPISRVLYQSLPLMLESCVEIMEEELVEKKGSMHKLIVIGQAVEFLQALLDMMTEQHIHLEVISQFFANIFFFVNAAMLNVLLEQGGEAGLFQQYSGTVLRDNLDLFEGWACQVGFKESVLRYLARFSGAIDLLATPTEKLLQLNWSDLCREFPVLHPAQLHFLLSQYLLPTDISKLPSLWTPSENDANLALRRNSLLESFEGHPGFTIPTSNYTLNLNHPPPDPEHFQDVLEMLRTRLQSEDESNNASIAAPTKVALLDGMKPPAPHMMTTPIISRWKLRRGTVPRDELSNSFPPLSHDNIGSSTESQEDLLKENSWRNLENLQQESHNSKVTIMDSCPFQNRCENGNRKPNRKPMSMDIPKERTGSVKSVLESPLSFPKPEKLVLDPWYYDNHVRVHPSRHVIEVPQPIGWTEKQQFPPGSRTVTVPRGEKGFGFIMVEQKVPGREESRILLQKVLPGSTADGLQGLAPGDHILAIEGQLLDGVDCFIAQKYVKEAEDELTLTLAPRTADIA